MSLDLRKPIVLGDDGNPREFDQVSQVLIGGGFVPTLIESGETWALPKNRQADAPFLMAVDGVAVLGGVLRQG